MTISSLTNTTTTTLRFRRTLPSKMDSPTEPQYAKGLQANSGSTIPSKRKLSPKTSLHLDLSKLPPAVSPPAQATNTVLITNIQNLSLFEANQQSKIRAMIESTAPVHTWVPLKSFRRILASFATVEQATAVRAAWDRAGIEGERVRVFYGPTISEAQFNGAQHLALPDAGKLFFISPPPSPPHGWEMKLEDAPNKMVHADDLAEALENLHRHNPGWENADLDMSPVDYQEANARGATPLPPRAKRSRSSTLIYHPDEHGNSPNLPAIAVVDLCDEPEEDLDMMTPEKGARSIRAQTARPPIETMHES
ncbi:calcipressin [Zalerion maritima]|uniref:Calcipressin n=1 Tax=Zalerion maritima TaxID=339359 RepID=A0AAD5RV35_9PEZI|nr:calcipressin [Zalerion maritima]